MSQVRNELKSQDFALSYKRRRRDSALVMMPTGSSMCSVASQAGGDDCYTMTMRLAPSAHIEGFDRYRWLACSAGGRTETFPAWTECQKCSLAGRKKKSTTYRSMWYCQQAADLGDRFRFRLRGWKGEVDAEKALVTPLLF